MRYETITTPPSIEIRYDYASESSPIVKKEESDTSFDALGFIKKTIRESINDISTVRSRVRSTYPNLFN